MQTFYCDDDYRAYLDLIAVHAAEEDSSVWAYCLMPNHVHLVVVPNEEVSLARLFRQVHRKYALRINERENWRGHLWQERFHSFVMDDAHLMAAVRYTELNPVRAGLCTRPEDWPWSSTRAHLSEKDDLVVSVRPMLDRVSDWHTFLAGGLKDAELASIRALTKTGRPAGDSSFVAELERLTGRSLKKKKTGPRPRVK